MIFQVVKNNRIIKALVSGVTLIFNSFKRAFEYVSQHSPIFLFLFTVFIFLVGRGYYNIAIFQPLEELAYEQSVYRQEQEDKLFKDEIIRKQLRLANLFMNNERYEAAKFEYEAVIYLDEYNIEARKGLLKISTYERFKNNTFTPDVVESQIKMLVDDDQNDPHVNVFLGKLYDQLELAHASIENYSKAIQQDVTVSSAWFGLGRQYEKQGLSRKAIKAYEQAVFLSKWNSNYLTNLAYMYSKTGNYKKAIENYETILMLDYSELVAYLEISIAYRLDGQFDMAYAYSDHLIRQLSDKKMVALKKNLNPWAYDIQYKDGSTEEISLDGLVPKKFYIFWTNALNHFVNYPDDVQLVESFIKKANSLICNIFKQTDADRIKKLVNYDIKQILNNKKIATDYRLLCQQFKQKYLMN